MELLIVFLLALGLISGSGEDYTTDQILNTAEENHELLVNEYGEGYVEVIESIDETDVE